MGHPVPEDEPPNEGDDCVYCEPGKTPNQIKVTISGVMDCPCLNPFGLPGGWYEADGAAANINREHILTQTGAPCAWSVVVHFKYKLNQGFADCADAILDREYNRDLWVTKTDANNVTIYIDSIFEGSGVVTSGCVSATISNDLGVGDCWTRGLDHPAMYGGTAVIKER